ncbi:phosphotransferase domain-containing protein [Candidatus Omnitrophus magneticus]|uniref:DNA polymerase beta n=1 Tax=Candidatus Omnitrophus magneticus TaxID=1609969 RepID=A0A0F0CK53_9BACT|nr:phosphotransferase domain-containing protein [Candidatus Omnitrophus magneticus]
MKNREISEIFSEIADILELKGDNAFRIRAYRTAGQNIINLDRQISDIYKEKGMEGLCDIHGIGKDLAEKIVEMIQTGVLKHHQELLKEFSPGFLGLLNISGIGPKKLKQLRDELNVNTVDDIEKACKNGSLETLDGMGEKSRDKLLEAIQYYKQQLGKTLLVKGEKLADELIAYLSESYYFEKLEKAGSLRRGQETIGDIDILAVTSNVEEAVDYFTRYRGAQQILSKGRLMVSIILKEGIQADLRLIEKSSFGAGLVYFTGSKSHNIKLRKIAKNKGLKVNEYGVFKVNDVTGEDELVSSKKEEDIYASLGMEWIPPELREDTGEIELALAGKIPKDLVELEDIKGDLHIHSTASDGRNSIEENIESAVARGYKYIALTDHSKLIKIAHGMDETRLLEHVGYIRKIAAKRKDIKILAGIEVDILTDGTLDLADYALKELDIVIASVHSKFLLEENIQTERIMRALDNPYVNILAHPSGRIITSRTPMQIDFERLFKHAVARGVYLEINTHGERVDLNDKNARRAKELGAKFVINTDAHDTGQMDLMKFGIKTARRAWLSKDDIINTKTINELLRILKRK